MTGEQVTLFPGRLTARQAIQEWLSYNDCDLDEALPMAVVGETPDGDLRMRPVLSAWRALRSRMPVKALWVHHSPTCSVLDGRGEQPLWVEDPGGRDHTYVDPLGS